MDLSSPLRSLVPTLDSMVLEVLAGTDSAMSLSQITRLSRKGTRQGLALVLERLVDHGLVDAEPANRGNMYRLNKDHVLAEAVLHATSARMTFLSRLEAALRERMPALAHASIFGSFARHEGGPASDIDLLLITGRGSEPDDDWYVRIRIIGDDVRRWTGNQLEYLVFSEREVQRIVHEKEPVVESWLAESITLVGPSIEALIARSGASGPSRG